MIRFGISQLPPDGTSDAAYLDSLVARGHDAPRNLVTEGQRQRALRTDVELAVAAEVEWATMT